MKNHIKIIIFLLCITFTLSSCRSFDIHPMPGDFPNTTWVSNNESVEISFSVKEESVVRFSGYWKTEDGETFEMYPIHVNEYGVIRIKDQEYKIFVRAADHQMILISEDLPLSPEGDDDWYSCLEKYTLLSLNVDYHRSKRFVATVEESKIDGIPAGTVLDFYRTDAK